MTLTDQEIAALMHASGHAGAHLDALGKTDLALMTEDEWMGFIESTVMSYAASMAQQHAPYAVLNSVHDPMHPDHNPGFLGAKLPF